MKQIHFATTNKGKVSSVKSALSHYGIKVVQVDIELPELRTDDLKLIAIHKARTAFQQVRRPVIAVDSGFFIPSLNGFPRTFVNFALETIGVHGILKLVENSSRECEFKNCLAYCDGEGEPKIFESDTKGHLADSPEGELRDYAWSALFLVFIPQGYDKTLAEMSDDEYFEWRKEIHKDSFASKFAQWFVNQ